MSRSLRLSAPFIWTVNQPIDPEGFRAGFMSAPERDEGQNRWYFFRKTVDLPTKPDTAPFHITVDGRYQLFVNGERVGRGPARCSPLHQRYDTYDLAPQLKSGKNVIAVLIRVFGEDMSWYEQVRGQWRPLFGDGGLWASGQAHCGGTTVSLSTDTDWRCRRSDAWVQETSPANHGLGHIEWLDARKLPGNWMDAGFDDSGWTDTYVMDVPEPFAPMIGMGSAPFPHLVRNPLPALSEDWVAPSRRLWTRTATPVQGALHEQAYTEPLGENDPSLVNEEEGDWVVTTPAGAGIAMMFAFDRLQTIYPVLEIDAQGGEEIDIAVSETLPGEWDGAELGDARIERNEVLGLDAHLSRYVCKPGLQTFERFEWQAARYMQVTVRNAPDGVTLKRIGGTQTHFPARELGSFASNDPFLDQLWSTGRYTLQLCMHDGWEDCPSREQRQWLGDATVENLVGHAAFGQDIAVLNAEFLRKAAESQRPDGLTQMFAPGNHKTNAILIPDWTLQWILNAGDHLRLTGDLDVIKEIMPNIEKALGWFARTAGDNRLLVDSPYWHFMDWAGLGRAGEACAINAEWAGALKTAAMLSDAIGNAGAAERYRADANAVCDALNARHWDAARGVYVDCIDPRSGELMTPQVSQHANAAMILWGDAPEDRWAKIVDYITDPKRITFTAARPIKDEGETLDPEIGVVMCNTFYSHFLFEALAKAGRLDKAFGFIRYRYKPMLDAGATTLWESFGPTASLCHGFSASPTWMMSAHVLGVRPDDKGAPLFAPNPLDLDKASGTVPTRWGDATVELNRNDIGFSATLNWPEGAPDPDIHAPKGFTVASQSSDGTERTVTFQPA
ncbi:MAG: alpha-L-rhamnosidase N-terminal domain-containing protein [Pseudomonadota bacterium]